MMTGGHKVFRAFICFFLGALCFFATQPLTRIPLLNLITGSISYQLWQVTYPGASLIMGILIPLSAGLFEEGGRCLFKWALLRPAVCSFREPLIFGFGHGLCEAVLLLAPLVGRLSFYQILPGILERVLTIAVHIGLTVMVWNGFQKGKRLRYLLCAVLAHGLLDGTIPASAALGSSLLMWTGLIVAAIALIIYAVYSRRYYAHEPEEKAPDFA